MLRQRFGLALVVFELCLLPLDERGRDLQFRKSTNSLESRDGRQDEKETAKSSESSPLQKEPMQLKRRHVGRFDRVDHLFGPAVSPVEADAHVLHPKLEIAPPHPRPEEAFGSEQAVGNRERLPGLALQTTTRTTAPIA